MLTLPPAGECKTLTQTKLIKCSMKWGIYKENTSGATLAKLKLFHEASYEHESAKVDETKRSYNLQHNL